MLNAWSIQDHQRLIEDLQAENEALKIRVEKVDILKSEIESIKAMLGMNNEIVKK